MDYFTDVHTTFQGLGRDSCFAVYAGSESFRIFYKKNLNLCSEYEQISDGFGMTLGWVINDRISIWVNYPFKYGSESTELSFCVCIKQNSLSKLPWLTPLIASSNYSNALLSHTFGIRYF